MARFVNLNRMLDLNRDQSERMGQQVAESMQPQMNAATQAVGRVAGNIPGAMGTEGAAEKVGAAEAKLAMSGTMGGREAMLGKGANAMDAYLAGQSQNLTGAQQRFGGLKQQLQAAEQQSAQRLTDMQRQQAENDQRQREADAQAWQKQNDARLQAAYQQQKKWRLDNNVPNGSSEYAEYSDSVMNRPRYKRGEKTRPI